MRKYRKNAATQTRTDYGTELIEGLNAFVETSAFAAPLAQRNDALDAAFATRQQARRPLVKARAQVRVANFMADFEIRSFARACEVADGGRRGPVFDAAFPNGVVEVVAPVGKSQAAATRSLMERVAASKHAGLGTVWSQWQARVQAVFDRLTTAAQAYQAAFEAHQRAFSEEVALRDDHALLIDTLMGQVRATFPGDRDRQDAIFPSPDSGDAGDEASERAVATTDPA